MNSFLLHGDNQVASREKLVSLVNDGKKNGLEVVYLDNPSKKELLDVVFAQGLFGSQNLIVVENFLTADKEAGEILSDIPKDTTLIIWEKRLLTAGILKKLSGRFTVLEFKLPTVLFALLDNIYPKNTKKVLELLETAKRGLEAEFVLIMLASRVRQLLWAKLEPAAMTLPLWQKGKLIAQSGRYSESNLKNLNTKLLELDRKSKNSTLPVDLFSSLELLLTSI
ncbi:MAG: hypothetical protein HYW33_01120 [Candidatus Blackburnbacteria bacterium]|nr:hypothetical protein [Candidatus Blackburnbacteria bacterium]